MAETFRPPPPRASPGHPKPAEGKTDPAIALERLYEAHKEQLKRKTWDAAMKWTRRGVMTAAFFAGIFGFAHGQKAHEKIDAAKSATDQALEDEKHQRERDVDELKNISNDHAEEHRKLDRRLERVDTKLELLLDAARVPRSKRPTEDE